MYQALECIAVNEMYKKVPYLHGPLICAGGTIKTSKIKCQKVINAMKKNNTKKGNISLLICQQMLIVLPSKYTHKPTIFAISATWASPQHV